MPWLPQDCHLCSSERPSLRALSDSRVQTPVWVAAKTVPCSSILYSVDLEKIADVDGHRTSPHPVWRLLDHMIIRLRQFGQDLLEEQAEEQLARDAHSSSGSKRSGRHGEAPKPRPSKTRAPAGSAASVAYPSSRRSFARDNPGLPAAPAQ